MRQKGKYPAIEQAIDFVLHKILPDAQYSGKRLPSIRLLAERAEVSCGTMFKAVTQLKQKKLITGKSRHHMSAGDKDPELVQKSIPIWQKKRMLLEKDIISGAVVRNNKLPPLKVLQSRYGACFGTLKKVVAAMESEGVLVSSGKGYALPGITGRSANRIVFITLAGHFTQESALNHEHNRIVNLFENECIRIGLRLETIELDFYDAMSCRRAASKLPVGTAILGFVLDVWWYEPESYRLSYLYVLDQLSRSKKPTALLDEIGNFTLPRGFASNPLVQTFSIEKKRAGERIARFLLAKGHRSVAYLSSLHHAEWSQDRYEGLVAQYERAGYVGMVQLTAGEGGGGILKLLALSGLGNNEVEKVIELGRTPSQADDLKRQWYKFTENKPQNMAVNNSSADTETAGNLGMLRTILQTGADDDFLQKACAGVLYAASDRNGEIDLTQLFEKALKNKEVTAWICASDMIAFEALRFLRKRKIRVPETISVTGFDNVPVKALEQRLTTLDFNAMGFVQQMLNFITRPARFKTDHVHSVIEVEGIIMERNTTGKARVK